MANLKSKEPVRLRMKKLKNGNYSLYLDFYRFGIRSYEYLRLYIIPEKNRFDKERNRTTMIQAEAMKAKRIIEFQNGIYGVVHSSKFNNVFLCEYIENVAKEKVSNCINHYLYLSKKIKDYGDVPIKSVSKNYILGFIATMKKWKTRNGSPVATSTKALYLEKLSHVLSHALRDGIISTNPMNLIAADEKPKKKYKEICYLTINELRKLIATKSNRPAICNAFLFSCFTGLRYSDVVSLKWGELDLSFPQVIDKIQVKTEERIIIPLSKNAVRYLPERPSGATSSDVVFSDIPQLSSINRMLRLWAKAAGVEKHLSFHVARHTAATLWITSGSDLYTVSKMLGHTSIQSTQIYAKVVDSVKMKAVDLVPDLSSPCSNDEI